MRRCAAGVQTFWQALAFLWICLTTLSAEQSGLFTYRVIGDTVEITGYPIETTGPVTIPAEIDGKPVVTIGFAAFERCAGMTALTIPSSVTTLRGNAFYRCTGLTSLIIPSNVTSIERSAFGFCTSLTQVSLPEGLSTIGVGVFAGCYYLTDVSIPSSVTRIGPSAFHGCWSLTSLTLPPGVTAIEQDAFAGCTSLTDLVLPAALTSLGPRAFGSCTALTRVAVPSGITIVNDSVFFDCHALAEISLPPGLVEIGRSAFASTRALTGLAIPPSVTRIGDSAFAYSALEEIVLPAGLTSIGAHAFEGCDRMSEIAIPASVTTIGDLAFLRCYGLTAINVSPANVTYTSVDGILFNTSVKSLLKYPGRKSGPYAVPPGTVSIRSYAFEECYQLTGVSLPPSLVMVENNAFWDCSALASITVSPENTAFVSTEGVLFDAGKTTLIRYPAARSGAYEMPPSVSFLVEGAFSHSSGLTSLGISGSVKTIRPFTFHACSALIQVSLPASVDFIDSNAFSGCRSLTHLSLPPNLTILAAYAFSNCTSLVSVIFPPSMYTVGDRAFFGCPRLTSVLFLGDAPGSTATDAFASAPSAGTVYYFSGSERFTSPTWLGYASQAIDPATARTASWLMEHGWPPNADMTEDANDDGVSLFLAYALDLDPRLNQSASLPAPVLTGTTVGLDFHAARPELSYRVEASAELQRWTTEGVRQTAPGPDGRITATVPRDEFMRFLRLVITN